MGDKGTILTSIDGVNWNYERIGNGNIKSIVCYNNQILLIEDDNTVYISSLQASPEIKEEAQKRISNAIVLYIGSTKTLVNNTEKNIDSQNSNITPFIKDGRTLGPIRFIAENLGANVEWDALSSSVTVISGDKTIKFSIGSNQMYVNGKEVALDVPAQYINGRTFLPLRKLIEDGLGKKIFYNNKLIIISDTPDIIDAKTEQNLVKAIIDILK